MVAFMNDSPQFVLRCHCIPCKCLGSNDEIEDQVNRKDAEQNIA